MVRCRLEVLDVHNTYVARGSLLNKLDLYGSLFAEATIAGVTTRR